MQADLSGGLVSYCAAGRFGAVVTPQHRRVAASFGRWAVELGDQVLAGDAALDHSAEAFAGVFVDDGDDMVGRPSVVTSN